MKRSTQGPVILAIIGLLAAGLSVAPLSAARASTPVNDTSGQVTFTGAWTSTTCAGFYGSDCRYSNSSGATALLAFDGPAVSWIGSRNNNHGIANVQICNASGTGCGSATAVDTYASSSVTGQVLFRATDLGAGAHTLKITVTNTKNASSSGFYQDIDGFSVSLGGRTRDDSASVAYSGSWTDASPCDGYLDDDCHYSNANGASVLHTFSGTNVEWIGGKNDNHGIANVQICNAVGASCGSATAVDTYAAEGVQQRTLFRASGLSSGTHTIKITVTNTKNASSSGFYQDVDGFVTYAEDLATNTTYYVDNRAGSGCNPLNAGTSTSSPWCDFSNVAFQRLKAGTKVLLRAGATWDEQFGPVIGGGSSGNRAEVGRYGNGSRPHIARVDDADRGMWFANPDHLKVSGIEVSGGGMGIIAWYDSQLHQDLVFSDLYLHHNDGIYATFFYGGHQPDLPGLYDSVGLYISGDAPRPTAGNWIVKDILIDSVTATENTDGVDISGMGGLLTDYPAMSVQNVDVLNSVISDNWGGANFDNLSDLTIAGTEIYGNGDSFSPDNPYGVTNLFFWLCDDVRLLGNLIGGTPNTDSADQSGIDFEGGNTDFLLAGNWIGGSASIGIEVLNNPGAGVNQDIEVRSNGFQDNYNDPGSGQGAITGAEIWGDNNASTGSVTNNVHTYATLLGGTIGGFTQSANDHVATGDLYNAGRQFSGTQGSNRWSYQYFDGSSTHNLSYASGDGWWGSSAGFINPLTMLPESSSSNYMIRTWTAPKAGTIAVRGWIHKQQTGGDGIRYGIVKNSTWQSGGPLTLAGSDTAGAETNLDISVAAGDTIKFHVNAGASGNNTSDRVSWNPTIAYN